MLTPCASCHRHVRATEPRCAFCGQLQTASARVVTLVGRASRAVVFASAALAACDQGRPVYERVVPPAVGTVEGVATWQGVNAFGSHDGVVEAGVEVFLVGDDGKRRTTKTNEKGAFEFLGVPAGAYSLELGPTAFGRSAQQETVVVVHNGTVEHADLQIHVAMPYGAPPRRRRVV